MASVISTLSAFSAFLSFNSGVRTAAPRPNTSLSTFGSSLFRGLTLVNKVQLKKATTTTTTTFSFSETGISCSITQPETLQIVQSTIAKLLYVDEGTLTPQTTFAELGADSLDTLEIMMALEEKFGISTGEEGAEKISTVQDAADLIEKMKAQS